MRPSAFVVGPEGSGTTLLWRCLAGHPEMQDMTPVQTPARRGPFAATGALVHLSLPTLRPMWWVHPEHVPRGARVIVMRRSPVHTVFSAYRRFYDDPAAAWRAYFQAVDLEERYIKRHRPLCVAYEDLIASPAKVLRTVYEWLGIGGDFLPSIRWRTRNDRRWRKHAAFAAFMRSAFGDLYGTGSMAAECREDAGRASRARSADGTATVVEATPRVAAPKGHGPPRVVPGRFVRIDDLLAPREHARLLRYAASREADFAASTVISTDGTFRIDDEYRRSGTIADLEPVWDLFETRLRRLLPHVRRELELAWFPVGRVERQLAVHHDGGFFRAHADSTDPAVAGRCLTCVYYFHRRPKRFSGGELWLYDTVVQGGHVEKGDRHVSIDPADNTAVFFASDVYHEVRPVHRQSDAFRDSRFSLNVWFWLGDTALCLTEAGRRLAEFSAVPPVEPK